jgi:hypothetical protein
LADQVYIDRTELPSAMTARLVRLAAFQNPEFYRAQSMRFPTFGKPRIISCAELRARHVGSFHITAGFARHEVPGMLAEDAISVTLELVGRRIFHSGDTEYDSRIRPVRDLAPSMWVSSSSTAPAAT